MSDDLEYLLALAEEHSLWLEAQHRERRREERRQQCRQICTRLRDEIEWLCRAPFSWQVMR
jgi:hypothetical protein